MSVTARSDLTQRVIPFMQLSDGSATSMTPPPPKPSVETMTTPSERFAIKGNAIVAGGAGDLGLVSCQALLEHGLTGLMIFDVNPDLATEPITRLQAKFPTARIEFAQLNVTDEVAVEAGVERATSILGPVTTLVSFVGIVGVENALDMPVARWRTILDVNTTGAFICAQAVARRMVAHRTPGSITFISSISGHRVNFPQPQVAYNVSKAALLTLRSCLAAEWARYGIRTNTISPGYMDTILNEGDGNAEARRIWASRNPFGRMGSPSELTGAVVFLSSSAASYINGADIVADGGTTVFC